jgi:hypothetical protein
MIVEYLKTHVTYLVIITICVLCGRAWLQEHDARLLATEQQKVSEARIKSLEAEKEAIRSEAAQKVQVITKIVHDAKTPEQVVSAIPQLTNVPLNTRVLPDLPGAVAVDAQPLIEFAGQCKIDRTNLDACTKELDLTKQQSTEKDKVIVAIKKKPGFWKRVGATVKTAAIGGIAFEALRIALGGGL